VFLVPASASADYRHVVTPGETLTSVAATDGVSITALAGANRLSPDARLISGSVLEIPPRGTGFARHSTHTRTGHTPTTHARGDAASVTHPYVVRPGDTLSAIAARAGVSVSRLAALNGLRATGVLLAGATLKLPGPGAARTQSTAPRPTTHRYVVQRGDTLSAIAARAGVSLSDLVALNHIRRPGLLIAGSVLTLPGSAAGAPASTRLESVQHYVVPAGDTLSGIAARAGISVGELADANGINPGGVLLAGATLTLPAGSRPVGPPGTASQPPYPTPERVSASEVEQIATANGVPSSLAAAIGWQESGFNNDLVSSADARGVMQILPKTWSWIERALDPGTPLAPDSALDNVRGGVLLLHSLLMATHGNAALAAAGYIQGLDSVRSHGMYAVTRQYVTDVLSLRRMFGGP